MERPNPVEESIVRKFTRPIWHKFLKGVKEYDLVQEGDKIAVCISGGKDSMMLAKCMQRLQRYSKFPFEVEFIVMDDGCTAQDLQQITGNAALMGIPIRVFGTEQNPDDPYTQTRTDHLYRYAKTLGCNKIALGHHFDDVIETILMGVLCDSRIQTIMPKCRAEHFPGMELIRPLYLVRESDILAWKAYNRLEFTACGENEGDPKRQEVKQLLAQLRQVSPHIDKNIFRSVENVNLKTIISYQIGGVNHHFLDEYDQGITNHGQKTGEPRPEKEEKSC